MRTPPLLLFAALVAVGCNSGPRTAPVSGKVTLDGQPLANARVNFQPMGGSTVTGVGSYGKTDGEGKYTLRLIDDTAAGAIVGKHKVTIVLEQADTDEHDRRKGPVKNLPPKYNFDSELTFEVKPGQNTADFPLSSK
jgi:hypothetical protein